MAVYGQCQQAYSQLKNDIEWLKMELRKMDELILGFFSVTTAQAKHIMDLGFSCCVNHSTSSLLSPKCPAAVPHHDSTLPWSGSTITRGPSVVSIALPALQDDRWSILGAKPKTHSCSTPYMAQLWVLVQSGKRRTQVAFARCSSAEQ